MNKVCYEKRAVKYLKKLAKSTPKDYLRLDNFLNQVLPCSENPCGLPNAKHLKGFDNHYRWRLGDYRIIGIVTYTDFYIIDIVKIDKRDESTYKGL